MNQPDTIQTAEVRERAARRRRRAAIRREAEVRMAEMQGVSQGRGLYSPRVIGAAFFVLVVIGAVLVKRVNRVVEDDRPYPHYSALRSLNNLATALGRYRFHVGAWPTADQGLKALIEDPGEKGWLGPYIVQLKRDPWGTPYCYAVKPDGTPDIFTAGPDLKPGTPDDLRPEPESYDPGTDWTNGWLKVEDRLPDIEKILSERDRKE
jgi:general secretion pathway protein G